MDTDYIGKHRPKDPREVTMRFHWCVSRDAQARFGNYSYTARHNATVRGGAA